MQRIVWIELRHVCDGVYKMDQDMILLRTQLTHKYTIAIVHKHAIYSTVTKDIMKEEIHN
jgi:hypothetical protein